MLTKEQVTKFQVIYKKRFGEEIGHEEAYEKGAKLIALLKHVYKPIKKPP